MMSLPPRPVPFLARRADAHAEPPIPTTDLAAPAMLPVAASERRLAEQAARELLAEWRDGPGTSGVDPAALAAVARRLAEARALLALAAEPTPGGDASARRDLVERALIEVAAAERGLRALDPLRRPTR